MNGARHARGFTLLPVVLAMGLIAAVAFLLNRDNGFNANRVGAQADRERARYAAEAGLQAANYRIQTRACAGGYPTVGAPVSDNDFAGVSGLAYTAFASAANGWPLTLTSIGSFRDEAVTLTRNGVHAYQAGVRTWVTQPGPGSGKDSYVNSAYPANNYGRLDTLSIDNGGQQALIAFDLSPLPPGSRIVRVFDTNKWALQPGATISLYQDGWIGRNKIAVKLITQDWVAGTSSGGAPNAGSPGVSWNYWNGLSPNTWALGAGQGYDARSLIELAQAPWWNWTDIDVSAAALAWTSGVYPNYGVWLVPFSDTQNYLFVSSNDDNSGLRPKLTASYLLPCGASAPS